MRTLHRWLGRGKRLAARTASRFRAGRGAARRSGSIAAYPAHYRVRPSPPPLAGEWPDPPPIERPFEPATPSVPTWPPAFDVALFEALNAEYAAHPVAPKPPTYDPATLTSRSRARLSAIHGQIGLAGMTVLEVGCGAGYEVWNLAHHLGSDAWGIDVTPRRAWPHLVGERVHLVHGDVADPGALPSNTFDRVISFTVWEHIHRPVEAFERLHAILRPGGLAWIRANLYRGPTASHLAREIAFPFPHLLFTDEVIAEGLRRAGKVPRGAAWVNRLTWEQYEAYILASGFTIRSVHFDLYPLDEPFYRRFEDVLGRYPRIDLERGFFTVVIEKPRS